MFRHYFVVVIVFLNVFCAALPIPEGHSRKVIEKGYQWLKKEPLLEKFPVSVDYIVEEPLGQESRGMVFTQRYPDGYKASVLTKLNHVMIEQTKGAPIREARLVKKALEIRNEEILENGKSETVIDVANSHFHSTISQKIQVPASGNLAVCFNRADASFIERQTISFMFLSASIDSSTAPGVYCLRDVRTNQVVGLNVDGSILFPGTPLHVGDQWEFETYFVTGVNTKTVSSYGASNMKVESATLVLTTYQLAGYTNCDGRRCAIITIFGQSYEMSDWAGETGYQQIKKIASTLSKQSLAQINSYFERRQYNGGDLQGSFQIGKKFSGYALFDYTQGVVAEYKLGAEGPRGGAAKAKSVVDVKNSTVGILREQIVIKRESL